MILPAAGGRRWTMPPHPCCRGGRTLAQPGPGLWPWGQVDGAIIVCEADLYTGTPSIFLNF